MLVYSDYQANGELPRTTTIMDCTLCGLGKSVRSGEIWAVLLATYQSPFSSKFDWAPLCFSYANGANFIIIITLSFVTLSYQQLRL